MKNSPFILMGALDGEISLFKARMNIEKTHNWKGFSFYEGNLNGKAVILAKCGVGKVLSAMVTQHLIDNFSPSALIFTGIAGGLNPELHIGDIIVSRDTVQHDIDASHFKFERGQIPYTNYRFIQSDPDLLEASLSSLIEGISIIPGRILTGDQFINDSQSEEKRYLRRDLNGDAIDMEGASTALVCHVNEIPHLILRTISDRANGKEKINLREFLKKSSENSLKLIIQILDKSFIK